MIDLSFIILCCGGGLILSRVLLSFLITPILRARRSRGLGCGAIPTEPTKWLFGLDMVRAGLKADGDQRTPEFVTDRFNAMGRYTFGVRILGTSNLITAEPKNVQAILATQFNDFAMGRARKTNLKIVLGRSIFAVDGRAWNSSREALRPIFSRENIANLEMLEKHVQTLLACIEAQGVNEEGWTKPVGLAKLFPSLLAY